MRYSLYFKNCIETEQIEFLAVIQVEKRLLRKDFDKTTVYWVDNVDLQQPQIFIIIVYVNVVIFITNVHGSQYFPKHPKLQF